MEVMKTTKIQDCDSGPNNLVERPFEVGALCLAVEHLQKKPDDFWEWRKHLGLARRT